MKRTGICPKCSSVNVIKINGNEKNERIEHCIRIGSDFILTLLVHRYICCDCGFMEEWVDKEDATQIKQNLSSFHKSRQYADVSVRSHLYFAEISIYKESNDMGHNDL